MTFSFEVNSQFKLTEDAHGELKKFSGSAFEVELGGKFLSKRNLHHGTLLVDTDLAAMQNLLSPHVLKMKSKGIDSVRARVCNLKSVEPSLNHLQLVSAISESFLEMHASDFAQCELDTNFDRSELSLQSGDYHNLLQKELLFDKQAGARNPETLVQNDEMDLAGFQGKEQWIRNTNSDVFDHELVAQVWRRMTNRDWILGEAPSFSNNVEFKNEAGFFDIYYESEKGNFKSFKVFSDSLFSDLVENVEQYFIENAPVVCGREGVSRARSSVSAKFSENELVLPLVHTFFDDLESSFE